MFDGFDLGYGNSLKVVFVLLKQKLVFIDFVEKKGDGVNDKEEVYIDYEVVFR